jgi:predicted ATPase
LDALGRLAETGLVFLRGAPPHATYLFKHALVKDAAYGSLLRRRREELHARIAAVLEADFADRVAAEPELLARHLTEAGLFEKAVAWWQRAGERAAERSANAEAIAHLKRGLEILMRLPESRGRDEQELFLQAALIAPLAASEGHASAAIERAGSRGVELGGRIGVDSPAQFHAALARIWLSTVDTHRGRLRTALALQEENLGLAESQDDPFLLSRAYQEVGRTRFHLGDLAAARWHLERGLALYDRERDRARAVRYGFNLSMGCHTFLAHVLWDQGFPDEALHHAEEAIAEARAAAHPLRCAIRSRRPRGEYRCRAGERRSSPRRHES